MLRRPKPQTLNPKAYTLHQVESCFDGIDCFCTLSRAKFEELCNDLFLAALEPVERVLKDANFSGTLTLNPKP
jgi:heat shock protein 1/8